MAVFDLERPAAAGVVLERFETLQSAEIAKVKAIIHPAILAAMEREDRIYPEGMWPAQMVRQFQKEAALLKEHALGSISPEEYALREALEDVGQDSFHFWQDADDETTRLIGREKLASIIAQKIAEFLVKAEVSCFHLDELIEPSLDEFEGKRAA